MKKIIKNFYCFMLLMCSASGVVNANPELPENSFLPIEPTIRHRISDDVTNPTSNIKNLLKNLFENKFESIKDLIKNDDDIKQSFKIGLCNIINPMISLGFIIPRVAYELFSDGNIAPREEESSWD